MRLDQHYRLVGKEVIPCSLWEWAYYFENNKRHVADTYIRGIRISTIFLGLDHNFSDAGPPLLFETMVFMPDGYDIGQWRYSTYEEAEEAHKQIVAQFTVFKVPMLYLQMFASQIRRKFRKMKYWIERKIAKGD